MAERRGDKPRGDQFSGAKELEGLAETSPSPEELAARKAELAQKGESWDAQNPRIEECKDPETVAGWFLYHYEGVEKALKYLEAMIEAAKVWERDAEQHKTKWERPRLDISVFEEARNLIKELYSGGQVALRSPRVINETQKLR